ncbi:Uma2 family endonuclease [Coleofasciculus sp. FACHB-712]|uniref:Uma2 family endonuclease n=1 Tax=Coleofasciculus sp. FACHB-712 TaxID=2692789 RepID=UPI001684701D|nr:Uma2 family endonuclease [Coleofasciculus sp. FACHB-712]MBD1945128.1 Uma2 family endonuclease [Coleofasciculus sp. FACHB-712]
MSIVTQPLTLEEFLKLPETKPASEFIDGEVIQKPMPQGEHSRLQFKFCAVVNEVAEPQKIAIAFPELRCTFGGDSIVPDVVVFRWERIPLRPSGRIANRFEIYPDWSIEILSPDQSQTKVLGKLLHCSQHGTELGWLIDPEEESILVVFPEQRVQLLRGTAELPILSGIGLKLTVEQVFSWLTL